MNLATFADKIEPLCPIAYSMRGRFPAAPWKRAVIVVAFIPWVVAWMALFAVGGLPFIIIDPIRWVFSGKRRNDSETKGPQ